MRKLLLLSLLSLSVGTIFSQTQSQYFDGNDTIPQNTVEFQYSIIPEDVWYVGAPQKSTFNNAFSNPNALFTSKNGGYTPNNSSSFNVRYSSENFGTGILALQWMQKLHYQPATDNYPGDGGYIEFTLDSGRTWHNVFTSPYVYNFYGFDENNVSVLANGQTGFSGVDNQWRDIWLCFETNFFNHFGDILFRYTHIADDNASFHEGWMIDNFQMHITILHTITEKEENNYLNILPTPTNGIVKIQAEKRNDFHIIQNMELINIDGTVVEEFGMSPTKFQIDISHHPQGTYYLKVETNLKTEIHKIILVD
jgi:hypothetical protein